MMSQNENAVPSFRPPSGADFRAALSAGWADFRANPLPDLIFASFFVIAGLAMAWITYVTGHTFWLILAVMGFPLIGTLAAVGFYELSRRSHRGEPAGFGSVFAQVWRQRGGQLPWLSAIIIVTFMFWFFLGHMIFALFMGLSTLTNVSSSLEVYLTSNGLMMLAVGSAVGAVFATILYMITVLSIPMLLDRELDFVTAMIASFSYVRDNFPVMIGWGIFIAVLTFVAMVPWFLGLLLVLPLLGHASWHLYRLICEDGPS